MPTFSANISPLANSARQQASINQVLLARELEDIDIRTRRGMDIFNSFVNSFNTGVKRREVESDASMLAKRSRQNFGLRIGSTLLGTGVGAGIGALAGAGPEGILRGAIAGSSIGSGAAINPSIFTSKFPGRPDLGPANKVNLGSSAAEKAITTAEQSVSGESPIGIPPFKESIDNLKQLARLSEADLTERALDLDPGSEEWAEIRDILVARRSKVGSPGALFTSGSFQR